MRIVAFNGSPRKKGNTHHLLQHIFRELEAENIVCEEVLVGGHLLYGCRACMQCLKTPGRCAQNDDPVNQWIDIMRAADGLVLASPTYFANVSTEMKALIDRASFVFAGQGKPLRRRVGVPVVAARRTGAIQAYNALLAFFSNNAMIVPMANYWPVGLGLLPGDVRNDDEGLRTLQELGRNMAWTMKKLGVDSEIPLI